MAEKSGPTDYKLVPRSLRPLSAILGNAWKPSRRVPSLITRVDRIEDCQLDRRPRRQLSLDFRVPSGSLTPLPS